MSVPKNSINRSVVSVRIKDLQKKIQDESYLDNAIDRIAVIISRQLVEGRSTTGNSAAFLVQ
ncbi:MAG: hypothetical protein IIT68_02860 [Treponema sp.]|nr:hypothetical protein [Treponema sp.]